MRAATCTTHPGIRLNPGCYKCGPEEEPVDESMVDAIDDREEREYYANAEREHYENAEREYYAENAQTTLFPPVRRADVPMVKITISGTIELTQEQYQAYLDGGTLGPGAVVDVRASGYVVLPGAAWVKRTEGSGEKRETWHEREGRIKIRLVDLGALVPTGEEWSE